MSNTLNILLRCDRKTPGPDGKPVKCRQLYIGPPSTDIEAVRQAAVAAGWTFKPGQPTRHIGAHDYCPEHKP